MLIRLISGTLSLLAFSAAILAGVWSGNDLSTVLLRAWWALILFLVFGAIVGWMAKVVLDEHLQTITPAADENPTSPLQGPTGPAGAEAPKAGS